MPPRSDEILDRVRKLAPQVAARADEIAMPGRLPPPAVGWCAHRVSGRRGLRPRQRSRRLHR
jgi:hypothetical protein